MKQVDIFFLQRIQINMKELNFQAKVNYGHGQYNVLPKTPYIDQVSPEDFKPYAVGYIELPGEIMVESRIVDIDPADLEIGMEMELTIEPFIKNDEGEELMIFAFKPSKKS